MNQFTGQPHCVKMTPLAIQLFCLVLVLVTAQGAHLPPYISPCKVRSPDFSACAVKSGNEAIPHLANGEKKLGIPTLNPLIVPFIELSAGDLRLNGTDTVVNGLLTMKLEDMKVDLATKSVILTVRSTEISLDLNYNMGGKIVALPIEGKGKGNIKFYNMKAVFSFDFEETGRKGNIYAEIKNDHLDIFPEKMTIQLDNLFNGNKQLGDTTNQFLNENWQEVLKEFGPAIAEIISSVTRSILVPLCRKVPLNEIFTDY
ncbi:protein takeout-like [Coccinella septempunctata]|uniref:protein takeout-like n=1 Tax=Coccinella septempunctata TaxID=41139 RepID=UPI001D097120|nr:protein takeout-like [Coccinella septempunctata]